MGSTFCFKPLTPISLPYNREVLGESRQKYFTGSQLQLHDTSSHSITNIVFHFLLKLRESRRDDKVLQQNWPRSQKHSFSVTLIEQTWHAQKREIREGNYWALPSHFLMLHPNCHFCVREEGWKEKCKTYSTPLNNHNKNGYLLKHSEQNVHRLSSTLKQPEWFFLKIFLFFLLLIF